MGYKDREKKAQYQNEWLKRRRLDWIATQGGACVQCGETERPFEIDHIDPKTKVSHRIWSWSAERREAELAKCQLLCVDCHYKKTGTENATGQNHGETLYAKGCRCEICVSTRAANKKRIRAERKALGLPYQ